VIFENSGVNICITCREILFKGDFCNQDCKDEFMNFKGEAGKEIMVLYKRKCDRCNRFILNKNVHCSRGRFVCKDKEECEKALSDYKKHCERRFHII